ncbi:succinylglutamate-semialdehyde dehydrogenase [Thorsellia kenyensis]|uniref:L-glutamate gamma-semialdehyde dehydrogenase n=1 Tax=Thorsellia kenyensis TaxID=1549888 RepID=A0ABV6C8X9_9GAMM
MLNPFENIEKHIHDGLDIDKNHIINGEWLKGKGDIFTKRDPFYDIPLFDGNYADEALVNEAVQIAKNSGFGWYLKGIEHRVSVLKNYSNLLLKFKNELAVSISKETGKPFWESLTEVQAMIGKVDISIDAYHARTPTNSSNNGADLQALMHKPHGVLVVLGPYNFPGHLPNGHIVPALIAGNSVLFKPSELTPLTGTLLVRLLLAAGVDKGVVHLINGARETGQQLLNHPDINGVLFTGSASTGISIHKQLAGDVHKLIALEMGGNNPLIIDDFDSLKAALYTTTFSSFISAGQRCTCARRLIVKNSIKCDDFLTQFISATREISLGAWDDNPSPFMGTVINTVTADKLLRTESKLQHLGAKALLNMKQSTRIKALLSPGVIDATGLRLPDEEYFGPLVTVYRYDSFEEAIDIANDTQFGLAAGLISKSPELFEEFKYKINAGIVNWNKPLTGASSMAPFGGIGKSGNHRPSAYYAADYCAYPVASMMSELLKCPEVLPSGLILKDD